MLFFSNPRLKYTLSSNHLNTSDKLIITSPVTKDVYIRPCISLIRYHMQIYISDLSLVYLPLLWWFGTQFFESKLVAEKISCFEMTNFWALNTLTIYSVISKIRVLIQITFCRNARIKTVLSKNNSFPAEEIINYIRRTEKKKEGTSI